MWKLMKETKSYKIHILRTKQSSFSQDRRELDNQMLIYKSSGNMDNCSVELLE